MEYDVKILEKGIKNPISGKKYNTQRHYFTSINLFVSCVIDQKLSDMAIIEEIFDQYVSQMKIAQNGDQLYSDLVKFIDCRKKVAQPTTIHANLTDVLNLFSLNQIDLSEGVIKQLREKVGKNVVVTEFDQFTQDDLKNLLNVSPIHVKTIMTVVIGSGCRIGELLKSEITDYDRAEGVITFRHTKNGKIRTVVLTTEAISALNLWIDSARSVFLKSHDKKKGFIADGRIFPVRPQSYYRAFNRALSLCGLEEIDENSGRRKLSTHSGRKFYYTQMSKAQSFNGEIIIGAQVGHHGLEQVYGTNHREEITQFIRDNEHRVMIHSPVVVDNPETNRMISDMLADMRRRDEENKKEIEELRSQLNRITSQNFSTASP